MNGIDSAYIMSFVWPAVQTIVWAAIAIGVSAGLGYYLFIVRRRRVWNVDIFEPKSGGKLHLISKDKIVEKKIKGGISLYRLVKKNVEVLPPPSEVTYRYGNKEYAAYLRVDNEYIPLDEKHEDFRENKKHLFDGITKALKEIKNTKRNEVEKKYIFIPLNRKLSQKSVFEPMDYDVDLLRITANEARQKAYADKQTFLQKWGALIGIGIVAVLLIVALYLSYDFAQNVIGQALGAADKVAGPLEGIVSKLGGTPPPS